MAAAALLAAPAPGQVARAIVMEDAQLPGAPPGHTVASINNTAVNHVGGYAVNVSTSDGVETISRIWGNANGGPGNVLISEATYGNLQQTSFESFYGISNSGAASYSALTNDLAGGATSLDGVWVDGTVIANEEMAASLPGQFWSFGSRPGITGSGTPYWVGGITDTQGGSTQNRGLFFSAAGTPILLGGDVVGGLPNILDTSNTVSFDYRFSAEAAHHIAEVQMDGLSSTENNAMVYDGAGLMVGGGLVREGSPVPGAVGGLVGENWDNFDFTGATEDGKWFFSGDTDADSDFDEIIVVNGAIQFREGDAADGEILAGSIEGAYMNEQGDLAFIWDVESPAGDIEALYFNGQCLLKEGDEVDFTGDGIVDAGFVINNFSGISSLTVGDQAPDGSVQLYFTGDVDLPTGEELEAAFCMDAIGAECFLVFGGEPGRSVFTPGSWPFETMVGDVENYWAVLLDDIPEFVLPTPEKLQADGLAGFDSKTNPTVLTEFAVQVVMYNPFDFPTNPEQYTHGLQVKVLANGRVVTQEYGEGTGMEVWAEVTKNEAGEKVLRFPFSIPGF